MRPQLPPHFCAELKFHFREHQSSERCQYFLWGDDCWRVVPMRLEPKQLEKIDALWWSLGMAVDEWGLYIAGDVIEVECWAIGHELQSLVKVGTRLELWDSGFFADGLVTMCSHNWL